MKAIIINILFVIILSSGIAYPEIDYYAYYFPLRKLIICSNTKQTNDALVLNEFENENGFTCLLKLKRNDVYNVSLHFEQINEAEKSHKAHLSTVDISIGNTIIFRSVNMADERKKMITIKLENGKLFYLPLDHCDIDKLYKCNFIEIKDALFMKTHMILNYSITPTKTIAMVEKSSMSMTQPGPEECDPPCENGVCYQEQCHCQLGYFGENCSIKMEEKEYRIGIILLVVFFLVSILIGALIPILIYACITCCRNKNAEITLQNHPDIQESWKVGGNNA